MNQERRRSWGTGSNLLVGIIFLVVGAAWLAKYADLGIPDWVFSWKMLLILIGLFIGLRDGFRNLSSVILICIGLYFLAGDFFPGWNVKRYLIPLGLIFAGLIIVFQPRRNFFSNLGNKPEDTSIEPLVTEYKEEQNKNPFSTGASTSNTETAGNIDNVLNIAAIFGNVKKIVISKNFKGGEVVSIFGGADVNLIQADMRYPVEIESVNIFGGTKLLVPASWEIKSEVVAIFGGVEDKRQMAAMTVTPEKAIILKGFCMFGGIEIKSY
jgi:predicted membrane protein